MPFIIHTEQLIRVGFILLGGYATYWVVRFFIHRVTSSLLGSNKKIDDKRVRTISGVLTHSGEVVVVIVVAIMVLKEFSIDTSALLASAGVLGFAVSFGAQNLIKDMIAGLFILVENQYGEGDKVVLEEIEGIVECLTLRKTVLKSKDNRIHHIPNGQIRLVSVISPQKVECRS